MTAVTRSDEPERRIGEALRARATGAGGLGYQAPVPYTRPAARSSQGVTTRTALLIALAAGAGLGVLCALLSLLVPGLLPAIG
jgi:hypothetical protein